MKPGKRIYRRDFTLIELMTAMAITGMLVVVIMQLTNQSIDLWRAVSEDVSTKLAPFWFSPPVFLFLMEAER